MPVPQRSEITRLLGDLSAGRAGASEELLPLVYDQLREIARKLFHAEPDGHTLQPTVLVHDAWLKLVAQERVDWRGRTHFLAIGAKAMRRILADHARARGRVKRGGDHRAVTFDEPLVAPRAAPDFLHLDAAIEKLERLDPRQGRIVELRFFAGLGASEIAEQLGVSTRTVEGDWKAAKAWLRAELEG